MKKLVLMTLCCFFCASITVFAQKHADRFVGVWQQYQEIVENGKKREIHLPVWKVLQSDGQFCTFLIANSSGSSLMTQKGTYEVVSDDVYNERIQKSITNVKLNGKVNPIRYMFKGKNRMVISYTLPNSSSSATEIWQRVEMRIR